MVIICIITKNEELPVRIIENDKALMTRPLAESKGER